MFRLRVGDRRSLTLWQGQGIEAGNQFVRSRCWFLVIANLFKHGINVIQGLQNHVHQFRVHLTLVIAQSVENVFGGVAAIYQRFKLKEAGAAFNGVKATENGVEQITVVRMLLKIYQLL